MADTPPAEPKPAEPKPTPEPAKPDTPPKRRRKALTRMFYGKG